MLGFSATCLRVILLTVLLNFFLLQILKNMEEIIVDSPIKEPQLPF